ncbi:MAG: ABC transporter permease [Eubacterium sp.]|nr:ABC transporter permease [Eubacterium sp.]
MLENLRISFQGIWGHKLRSLLTMLGIIIGIAAIIAIVSTIKGTNEQIRKNLIGSGTNTVNVRLTASGDYDYEMDYEGLPKGVPVISPEMREVLAGLDHVKSASLYKQRNQVEYIYYNSTMLQGGKLIGADIYYLDACGYVISSGRPFKQSDYDNYRKVALIDSVVSSSLFREENPIGKTIDIKGEPFIIIGTIEESSKFKLEVDSPDQYYEFVDDQGRSGTVIVPDAVWDIILQYDEPQNVKLLADSTENMSSVGKKAADLLNDNVTNKEVKYRSQDMTEQAQKNEDLSATTNKQLIWIASISLLVGGIGVMNIMLVSVTERTREIGLKKAIGARKNTILAQFLTEAAALTSLGGIIGTITGIILAESIGKISKVPVAISIPSVIIAIIFSMVIGIVFGFAPAVKAANLDPIVALRHE